MKKWYGLNVRGDIQYLGEFPDFSAVSEWDDKNGRDIIWIIDGRTLKTWQEQIAKLTSEHPE